MKIIGVGLNKTGTKTLNTSLRHWGFRHFSIDKDAVQLYIDGNIKGLLQLVEQYDSFEDWPWPLIYREIDQAFPGSKFILTRRKDSETWFRSLCDHAELYHASRTWKAVYGYENPKKHKREHIEYYENHNRGVREYFRDRPDDLLEVCWGKGTGGTSLRGSSERSGPRSPSHTPTRSP